MELPMNSNLAHRISIKRRALLLSCASLAIATVALAPQKARAQAFNGEISSSTNASQTSVGIGTETITVTGPTATINWTPDNSGSGTINFLPNGNSATFTNGVGVSNYTVVNRVVPTDPTRAIGLYGNINSLIDGSTGGKGLVFGHRGLRLRAHSVFSV